VRAESASDWTDGTTGDWQIPGDSAESKQTEFGEIKNLNAYLENDGGNAEMFVDRYNGIVRYSHEHESWFIWDGNRWVPDALEKVNQLALVLSKNLAIDALSTPGRPDERKLKRAIVMGHQNKISAALCLARSDPRIVIKREEIDVDNFLLGTHNGVIDLRTGQRRDGQKGDFITKSCGCDFDPSATAPRWIAFLNEIFDNQTDLVDYIQRAVGYTLSGDTREQCLFFLHGGGANGKSTFIEILMKLLGDYATTGSQNILRLNHYGREPLDEIASLEGYRFVAISETGSSRMDEARIKLLTGGDTVTGKPHYKEAKKFQPGFKLWIFGNSKPGIHDVNLAIWRRIKLIPFTVQFPDGKQDKKLKEKLLAELKRIQNWALKGNLDWQNEGRLIEPQCVIEATNEYQQDQDILREFISENIEPIKEHELAHKELYAAYKTWHADGSSDRPFSSKKITQMLRDRGYKAFQGHAGELRWWGIGLRKPEDW